MTPVTAPDLRPLCRLRHIDSDLLGPMERLSDNGTRPRSADACTSTCTFLEAVLRPARRETGATWSRRGHREEEEQLCPHPHQLLMGAGGHLVHSSLTDPLPGGIQERIQVKPITVSQQPHSHIRKNESFPWWARKLWDGRPHSNS